MAQSQSTFIAVMRYFDVAFDKAFADICYQ